MGMVGPPGCDRSRGTRMVPHSAAGTGMHPDTGSGLDAGRLDPLAALTPATGPIADATISNSASAGAMTHLDTDIGAPTCDARSVGLGRVRLLDGRSASSGRVTSTPEPPTTAHRAERRVAWRCPAGCVRSGAGATTPGGFGWRTALPDRRRQPAAEIRPPQRPPRHCVSCRSPQTLLPVGRTVDGASRGDAEVTHRSGADLTIHRALLSSHAILAVRSTP